MDVDGYLYIPTTKDTESKTVETKNISAWFISKIMNDKQIRYIQQQKGTTE